MSRNFTKGCWNRNMKVLYILPNHRGVLLKIRKQIPWSNIRTFQTFLEHFPRDVFTLQNFTLKVYPINCLLPAFLFATKSTENLKTQFLHLFLLLLKSEIRSMFFLVCLMGSLFTISCPATFNLWNMIPKNRENISQICTSVYLPTLNTYILFYTWWNRQGQRNLHLTKEWTTYICSCWCLDIISNQETVKNCSYSEKWKKIRKHRSSHFSSISFLRQ